MDEAALDALSADVADFWVLPTVPVLDKPTPTDFLRRAVLPHHPVIIRGLLDGWPAVSDPQPWTLASVCAKVRASDGVTVTLTPDGRADAPRAVRGSEPPHEQQHRFMYPCECSMPAALFQEMLEHPQPGDAVPYLSLQNDNLRTTYPELLADIRPLPLAAEAFGEATAAAPEAVNLWVGDERSVSSLHKDHFENLYCVVVGVKHFSLLPPGDVAFLTESKLKASRYRLKRNASDGDGGGGRAPVVDQRVTADDLEVTEEGCPSDTVPWIVSDPDDPDAFTRYPTLRRAHPLRVHVHAGEVLYIPPLWYHQVSQTCITVAVNFWFDMAFDSRFVFYQHIRRSKQIAVDEDNVSDA